ncbi:MAG: 5-formyltetrahydrofolate cyclo-ligase [Cyanobacteriota bacterium]|jgi:5-formyltetrahydrofolate cyclo-ligase
MGSADQKQDLRGFHRRRRREALPGAAAGLVATALRELPAWLARQPRGLHLGLYRQLGSEPDLDPLIAAWPAAAAPPLALPAVVPCSREGRRLVYLPWSQGQLLQPDSCGIPAPSGSPPLAAPDLGLLLVPALAIDRRGIRLGYGGGWYDRLRADPAWRAVPALVVLPAACVVEALPSDPWDVPFDGWIDESGLHWITPT